MILVDTSAWIDVFRGVVTWCLGNEAMIIHNDRDRATMERELGLVADLR